MDNIHRVPKNPLITVIIPCKTLWDENVQRCRYFCEKLPENPQVFPIPDWICSGYPAVKRNYGMLLTESKYVAFIDSDAYPALDWLTNALIHLENGFAGVCGPGVLPPDSSLLEQATDLALRFLPYGYRVAPRKQRVVSEFPTFNLIVNRAKAPLFKNYLTGEDSLFCRELNGLLLYDPKVLVYHHRRPLFRPYWKQISTYGKNRGRLIRLALLGWLSTLIVYPFNFIKGFFEPGAREDDGSVW